MQIGIDVGSVVYGTGVSDYTLNLVNELSKNYQDQLVLFGASLRRGQEIKDLFSSAKTFPIPPSLLEFIWNRLHVVPVESLIGKVDVFHGSDWTEPPSKAAKVTTVHDLSPFLFPQEMDPQIVAVHTRKMAWSIKECRKFICVSQNTANDLQRLFAVPSDKIVITAEAVPSRFLLTPRITKHSNYLVAIGARQKRKNIDRLVRAYLAYKDKLDLPKKMIIIGENSSVSVDPAVTFTGYVDDQTLVDLLAGAEAFVYPSLYEGFGLPILEAFYHQVAVAASNTSAIPEVVGEAGVLFDPYDEVDIAKGIKQAIESKTELTKKGQARLANYTWEKTATQTLDVYKSLC